MIRKLFNMRLDQFYEKRGRPDKRDTDNRQGRYRVEHEKDNERDWKFEERDRETNCNDSISFHLRGPFFFFVFLSKMLRRTVHKIL